MTVQAIIVRGDRIASQIVGKGPIGPTGAQGPAGDVAKVTNRTALAAIAGPSAGLTRYLTESGREGAVVFSTADLSTEVAADTAQGVYVAPSTDTTGASGAWVRKFGNHPFNPTWFGIVEGAAAGANATVNNAALSAMQSCLLALAANNGVVNALSQGEIEVAFPAGAFEFSQPFDLTDGAISIRGQGRTATFLLFFGCTGIRTQSTDTSGASTLDGTAHITGNKSTIRELSIKGDYVSGAEAEFHGVHARAQTFLVNVDVRSFAGDGYRFETSGTIGGNTNTSFISNCTAVLCRNGAYLTGSDSNAVTFINCDLSSNRQWGAWDASGLGNSFIGCEFSSNAVSSLNDGVTIGASIVSDGVNRYFAIAGQESGASTNAPSGTTADNTWWAYWGAGGAVSGKPLWTSGMVVRAGGAFHDDGASSTSHYTACYAEQDQAKAQTVQRSLIIGGMAARWAFQNPATNMGSALIRGDGSGVVHVEPALENVSGSVTTKLGGLLGNTSNTILSAVHSTVSPSGHFLSFDSTANDVRFAYNNLTSINNLGFIVSGPSTTQAFGTTGTVSGVFCAPLLAVGDGTASLSNARRIAIATAAPATGAHGGGEWYFHRGTGNQVGFKCTAQGTPGTWASIYGIGAPTTGWAADTGTAKRTTNATYSGTAEAAYTQATIQTLMDKVRDLSQTIKALKDDLLSAKAGIST